MRSFFCAYLLLLVASSICVSAELVEHTFQVETIIVERVCERQEIIAINGQFPGPTIYAHEGDTIIVHVFNQSPYEISIHWHGLHMLFNCWRDGASYVSQCPILPGSNFTYKFNISGQEGTLWWHAHTAWLRATVHGALIIYPKLGRSYPFQKPVKEFPILLGEWWRTNVAELEDMLIHNLQNVYVSNAFTMNGQPGDFYWCSSKNTYRLKVKRGNTYLLRIINAAVNIILHFKVANHKMTVVATDASYTNPYTTYLVVIGPGQTTDVLLEADQPPASYYMAAGPYVTFNQTIKTQNKHNETCGIISYEDASSPSELVPVMPTSPDYYDISTIHDFFSALTGLTTGPFWVRVPEIVDKYMFINVGLGVFPCNHNDREGNCYNSVRGTIYGNMNNVSFVLPHKMSMLEAFFYDVGGVYTTDFPEEPPVKFDYTNPDNQFNEDFVWIGEEATKVTRLRYNSTVQIVLQNTALVTSEEHPIHLHGFDFYVMAQGVGNYDSTTDEKKFNLVNPHKRNTVVVPEKGWVVIRFRANNPGVWLMHCHFDFHMSLGLATAFVVENGPTPSTSLPSPPLDLPKCNDLQINSKSDQSIKSFRERSLGST